MIDPISWTICAMPFDILRIFSSITRSSPSSVMKVAARRRPSAHSSRSEEHTSELQSLMRISYAVFCLKKKINITLADQLHHTTPDMTQKIITGRHIKVDIQP